MNFAELRTAFYDYVDDQAKDLFKTDKAARLINEALRMLARKLESVDEDYYVKCSCYNVVSSATDLVFDLPADFKRIKLLERVQDTGDPIPFYWVDMPERHEWEPWPPHKLRTHNRPAAYMIGERFGIVTPNEEYTARLWYAHSVPELSDEGDIPSSIPTDFHGVIALQAAKLGMSIENQPFPFQDELGQGIDEIVRTTGQRQRQQPRYVHVVDWQGRS
jgi:hypothetical protein